MIEPPDSQPPEVSPAAAFPRNGSVASPLTKYDAGPYRPPQFTLRFLAVATALVAAWFAAWPITAVASRVVMAVVILTYLFGCARTRRSVLVMLPAIYLPHLWIFLIRDYPWTDYRWMWIKMFWQLPGLAPEAFIRLSWRRSWIPWQSEFWLYAVMAFFAIAIWLIFVALGRLGGRWLWITAGVAFGLSLVSSRLEQILFRM